MCVSTDAKQFEVVLAHVDGNVRVKLGGDLDFHATVSHAEELQEITDLRARVVLDLADVRFIDSSGVAFLVRLARVQAGRLRLENVPPPITSLLARMGLADRFDLNSI